MVTPMMNPLAVLAVLTLPQEIHVVDISGQGDFRQVSDAIPLVAAGDLLLVQAGEYAGFDLNGKGLSIAAHPEATSAPRFTGPVRLFGLPAEERIVLDGLVVDEPTFEGYVTSHVTALVIQNNDGSIRIQDCEFVAGEGLEFENAPPAAFVTGSSDLSLNECTLQGGAGLSSLGYAGGAPSPGGGQGLFMADSRISIHRSIVGGGNGGDLPNGGIGGGGGPGVWQQSGRLYLGQSLVRGGDSGDTGDGIVFGQCINGGPGLLVDPSAQAAELGSIFVGGEPGTFAFSGCTFGGEVGMPIAGNVVQFAEPPRAVMSPAIVRAGETFTTSYFGRPGDLAARLISMDPTWKWKPGRNGALLVDPDTPFVLIHGFIDPAGGSLDVQESLSLPANMTFGTFYTQGLFISQEGQTILANPKTITVLDPAF